MDGNQASYLIGEGEKLMIEPFLYKYFCMCFMFKHRVTHLEVGVLTSVPTPWGLIVYTVVCSEGWAISFFLRSTVVHFKFL